MNTNEGGAGISDGHGALLRKRVRKKRGTGGKPGGDKNGVGEKWFDAEIVKNRAELREDGKLGVWESEKFVLWRQYSGKTFDELEDLVSMADIEMEEMYRMASVYWLVVKKMTGKLSGWDNWRSEDLGMLFFMKRLQDANGGCLFTRSMVEYYLPEGDGLRPFSHTLVLTNGWVKRMRRKGLIEQVPGLKYYQGRKIAMFRVSADGRRTLKSFLEAFRGVHQDIRNWVKNTGDSRYLRRYMARFTLGMDYHQVNEDDTTFEDMLELTKRDLRALGHKGLGGKKTDYWDKLSEGE